MAEEPFFKVKKGADNFTAEGIQFKSDVSRPIVETEAKNTRLKDVSYVQKNTVLLTRERKWFSMDHPITYLLIALIVIIVGGLVLAYLVKKHSLN